MIHTFAYRTKIGEKEFQHMIHAQDVDSSLSSWINQIKALQGQVYSFNLNLIQKICYEFENGKIELRHEKDHSYLVYRIDNMPQITYIDKINKGAPDFIAKTTYLLTNEGGRNNYAASGYRPHFQIEGKKEMTSAEQIFVGKDKIYPGESVVAEIRILWIDAFEGLLYEGLKFKLGEGSRIVAEGEIIEVINKKLKRASS
jgi:hypothetical protein